MNTDPSTYDVLGRRYYVLPTSDGYRARGVASWYGRDFHGLSTSSGETYNMNAMTAAHTTLPIPTWVEVTNLENGKHVVVKVNDRGPFVDNRLIDLSYAAALELDMVQYGLIDAIVSTGASIIDMDFFEALGFKHYQAKPGEVVDDRDLRANYIDRIYDTYIDEEELQACDHAIYEIANSLQPRPYSSREFIHEMGRWLAAGNAKKPASLIQTAYEEGAPIFCPAFTDSSAGFGLVKHQVERMKAGKPYLTIDSVADFRELTDVKIAAGTTGLFMVGGGVPKNFAQDTVVCAEILGEEVDMHKYAVQITVADVRDGACSSSTLKEACSWGKVDVTWEQMVFAEATTVVPLIASDAWHRGGWRRREKRRWAKLFEGKSAA